MGLKDVHIVLDNIPSTGFVPGYSVSGKVKVIIEKPTQIKSLTLLFEGKAKASFYSHHVTWFKDQKSDKTAKGSLALGGVLDFDWNSLKFQRRLTRNERFVAQQIIVQIPFNLSEEACLEQGTNEYPFSFKIPNGIPSTYNCELGTAYIRYKLKAKWSLSGLLANPGTFKIELSVVNPKSLSLLSAQDQTLFNPREYRISTPFKVLFFGSSKHLTVVLTLPKTAVVVGETINVGIEIDNSTKVELTSVSVKLVKRTAWLGRYWVYRSVMMKDVVLLMKPLEAVPAFNKRKWNQPITVKAQPAIYIEPCTIIKIHHLIKVEIVPSGIYSNVILVAPIVVCWAVDKDPSKAQLSMSLEAPSTSSSVDSGSAEPPTYPGPPSYSEATSQLIHDTDTS